MLPEGVIIVTEEEDDIFADHPIPILEHESESQVGMSDQKLNMRQEQQAATQDVMVQFKNELFDKLMMSLDLPTAYKRGGKIDLDSYLREKVFFEVIPEYTTDSRTCFFSHGKVQLNDG